MARKAAQPVGPPPGRLRGGAARRRRWGCTALTLVAALRLATAAAQDARLAPPPDATQPAVQEVLSAVKRALAGSPPPQAGEDPLAELLPVPLGGQAVPGGAPVGAGGRVRVPLAPRASQEEVTIEEDQGLITLSVREGSLRRVVALIAETQRLNIVFAGQEDPGVTAAFERTAWQTVLDALLGATGYAWQLTDNVLFVAPVSQADAIPASADGRAVEVFELDFASALDVQEAITGLLSPAGKMWIMESSPEDNRRTREAVSVVDYPRHVDRIRQLICQLDVPPRQVLIETHILAVDLSDECRHGVNFEELIRWPSASVELRNVGSANTSASPGFFIDVNGVGLDSVIEMLKTTTDAKTLASPRLHAVSGQAARIQIGEQLGFRVTTTTQTSSLESVQFLDVGVVLEVTPRITRDGRVLMRIWPKVSTGEVSVVTGLPSEETTEVETDVLVNSGQGLVIGGLIQEVDSISANKIPWLGDIPYLGLLFQNRRETKKRTEIIVTLRPHVLPYEPHLQARNDAEVRRTETPLTYGAICSFPRPEEPRLPDALRNPGHVKCDAPEVCLPPAPAFVEDEDVPLARLPQPLPEESGDRPVVYEAGLPRGNLR